MLTTLHIRNVVLIDQLEITFQAGFCTLTGETGAGKSILLDSLGLALGARSDSGLIRKNTEQASVTAEFSLTPDHPAYAALEAQDIDCAAGSPLILRRTIKNDGRSRAFINDQPVSVGLLKEIGAQLLEIHGQFETQGLLDARTHGGLLDAYARIDTVPLAAAWAARQDAKNAYEEARREAARLQEEEIYLRKITDELTALAPEDGEEEKLSQIRQRLMQRESILTRLQEAARALEEADSQLGQGARALERAGDGTEQMLAALDRAFAEIREVSESVQSMSLDLSEPEHSLESIDERLFALRGIARKLHCFVDDLPGKLTALQEKLAKITDMDAHLATLEARMRETEEVYKEKAAEISRKRQGAALDLAEKVMAELPPLKLEKAIFVTEVEAREDMPEKWGPSGWDRIRFLIATNPGSDPGPLDKIASGGEMSRFMLALKLVMTGTGAAGTFVFDEIDSGIGGATAAAVGERLALLAKDHQILVVTHAPQVAAHAHHHWLVCKADSSHKNTQQAEIMVTDVLILDDEARQSEIARMLAGSEVTDEARAAAQKLLDSRAA